jgi:hypothetical protein
MFQDVKPVSNKAASTEFTHVSMINLAKEYHNQVCTTGEECITFETKVDKKLIHVKFAIYGGYEFGIYKEYTYPSKKYSTNAMIIGGRLEISSPRWNKSLSGLLDLSYTKSKGFNEDYNNYYRKYSIPKLTLGYVWGL